MPARFINGGALLNNLKDMMRRDWDERARHNAYHYIASWRKDWDESTFFESGEQDYLRLVAPIFQKLQFDPSGKSMAELGCGAGRMTRCFAQRFQSVYAVDISSEMQSRAKQNLAAFSNVRWVLSDGETLSGIPDGSVDFVFSYLVLQHMPDREIVFSSIRDMMRILRSEGLLLFQFNGGSLRPTMNWKGRLISAALDGLASAGLRSFSRKIAAAAGIDPEMVGKTWRGAELTTDEISAAVRSGGGLPQGFADPGTPLAWCFGRKPESTT